VSKTDKWTEVVVAWYKVNDCLVSWRLRRKEFP